MNQTRIFGIVIIILGLINAHASEPPEAAGKLAETELAFAKMAIDTGMTQAFLKYLHNDAVVFRPEPLNGKRWYAGRGITPAQLKWWPNYVEVAQSGDLGLSTGPWEFRTENSDTVPVYFGEFVSIWRKQPDGSFLVMADVGISHEKPDSATTEISFGQQPDPSKTLQSSHSPDQELALADSVFATIAAEKGISEAYGKYLADDARVYREGSFPVFGKKSADSLLAAASGYMNNRTNFLATSEAGDFGYTYGISSTRPRDKESKQVSKSSYLRVWRKNALGNWTIALDIALPIEK